MSDQQVYQTKLTPPPCIFDQTHILHAHTSVLFKLQLALCHTKLIHKIQIAKKVKFNFFFFYLRNFIQYYFNATKLQHNCFYLNVQLPLLMWCPLANHNYFMKIQPINMIYGPTSFSHLSFSFGDLHQIFPPGGLKYSLTVMYPYSVFRVWQNF